MAPNIKVTCPTDFLTEYERIWNWMLFGYTETHLEFEPIRQWNVFPPNETARDKFGIVNIYWFWKIIISLFPSLFLIFPLGVCSDSSSRMTYPSHLQYNIPHWFHNEFMTVSASFPVEINSATMVFSPLSSSINPVTSFSFFPPCAMHLAQFF